MRMKQKVNISWLPIRLGTFILLFVIPQLLSAQEKNDSLRITRDSVLMEPQGILHPSIPEILPESDNMSPVYPAGQPEHLPHFSLKKDISIPYQTNPSPLFRGDYSTNGVLYRFSHGVLFGSGSQTSMAGIGRFNNASLGYQHIFNEKFELQLHANTMKINMSHISGQAFSTSGAFLYHPTDRLTFKVFGSYDIGNSYGMSTHNYGATMSFDMSDRFGMEMGVQRYYDTMRGRWETVPVVIPYYNFDKFKLGLDVGGILYEVLRNVVFDKNRGGSPTIGPPPSRIPIR